MFFMIYLIKDSPLRGRILYHIMEYISSLKNGKQYYPLGNKGMEPHTFNPPALNSVQLVSQRFNHINNLYNVDHISTL